MINYLAIPITLLVFFAAQWLHRKLRWALLNAVLVSIAALIALLLLFDVPYQQYQQGSWPLVKLLEPAVVALAWPLYRQLHNIRASLWPLLSCCLLGSLVSISTVVVVCFSLQVDPIVLASLAPQAVTTPIAMEVARMLNGIPALAAIVVVCVGLLGSVFGITAMRLLRINLPQAQGLAMGASSHALGTAKVLELGMTQAAYSSLALVLCGVFTTVLAPLVVPLLLNALQLIAR